MGKKLIFVILALVIVGVGGYMLLVGDQESATPNVTPFSAGDNSLDEPEQSETSELGFGNPKKSAHYESNTPEHGAVLAGVPINVVIDFNFDLAVPSEIKILDSLGTDFGVGETVIDENKLSLRREMSADAPDGIYTVEYNACWPDSSCHDGNFQFAIDRTQASEFTDMRNEPEVLVDMRDIAFSPPNLIVSAGTKVTWTNSDEVDHYINTDSHPAHTYYLGQNSSALKIGESYSVVFDKPGIYPYHCSAHADVMPGMILVE